MTDERQNIPVEDESDFTNSDFGNGNIDDENFVDNFIENPEDENNLAENEPESALGSAPEPVTDSVTGSTAPPPPPRVPPPEEDNVQSPPPREESVPQERPVPDDMGQRLERLGGEPAPVITPEEFARLQKSGQVNIDARGRVRTARRDDAEAGVSLRKRRAWYSHKRACAIVNF